MSEASKNFVSPFVLITRSGEERVTLFSGGCQLLVYCAHPRLKEAWEWFESGLQDADRCEAAINALYQLAIASGAHVQFTDREESRRLRELSRS